MRNITDREFKSAMKKAQYKNKMIERKRALKKEKNKYKPLHSAATKMKTSNKILIIAIIAILTFTVACLYIQCTMNMEVSSTLITLWYSFWTVEVVSLAGIKMSKVKHNYSSALSDESVDDIEAMNLDEENEDSNGVAG